jgi:hypothetical protein
MQFRIVACAVFVACGGGSGGEAADGGHAAALVEVTPAPGTASWLHAPVRFHFDQPVDGGQAQVEATVGGVAVAAAVANEAPDTVVVRVDPAAAGTGDLQVRVTGLGEAVAEARYTLAPWAATEVVPDVDAAAVAMVDGDPWVATASGPLVVRRYAGAWAAVGAPLGSDAHSPAIAVAGGTPFVAWIDGAVAHVARWDGAWHELASPGAGRAIALAVHQDALVAAVFGASAAVRRWREGWEPVGDDLALPGFEAGALAAGDRIAIAWSAQHQVQVARFDGGWTRLSPIATGPRPSHFSLAARGDAIAVAWDAWAGSMGVVAARAVGDDAAFRVLGRLLDVDPASDATAPAIAIDDGGAPVVAWTEAIDGHPRGVVARWTDRWSIVAGASFGEGPPAQLVLGDAPVVAMMSGGVQLQRLNGAVASGRTRGSIAGCGISASAPPARLSTTGCFAIAAVPVAHAGLVPYRVVNELWADTTHKRRWIGLPDGAPAMTVSATGAWTPPAGTILVKEFALERVPGEPASRRPIETRFLVRDPALGWQGFSYRWLADGSDAMLQPDEAQTVAWPLADGTQVPHVYPSRSHCLSCHENSYGPLLGLRTAQLQRWIDDDGVIADQIPLLARLGVGPLASDPPLISPHDPSQPVEQRMRGYMAANCAHCHNPDHIAIKDLRFATPLADTRLCEAVTPGSPASSVLYQKVSSRPGMPPLGTALTDPLAIELVSTWITGLRSCP